LKAGWKEQRLDLYIAAVIIPSVILSAFTLWILIRQYHFIRYVSQAEPKLFLNEAVTLGSFSRISIFAFALIIMALFLILVLGSFLSAQNMQRQLEVTRLKSEFISTVSHELKTPLTSIRLLAERLLNPGSEQSGKQKEYLNLILKQSCYLSYLIGNTLDFSKIEEGREKYILEKTDLRELLKTSINNYPAKLIRPDCSLEINIASDLPLWYVDKDGLARAFVNLLDNALKFSPAEGIIKINAAQTNDGEVYIEVIDQGPGIAEQDKEKIFERFYHTGKGTGLGLTLVRHIVQGHKGRIELASEIGKGSRFRMILPK